MPSLVVLLYNRLLSMLIWYHSGKHARTNKIILFIYDLDLWKTKHPEVLTEHNLETQQRTPRLHLQFPKAQVVLSLVVG